MPTTLTRDEAEHLLFSWTPGVALRRHARAVEIVMRAAAHTFGRGAEDEHTWALAGLLHDADYETWPEEHPQRIVAWLEERGERELAHAILCHYTHWGHRAESPLDRALLACDELTGFVCACCYVRPGGIDTLEPASVVKKLKDRAFAAKVDRDEIRRGALALGTDVSALVAMIIGALAPHRDELGLAGR